MLLWIQIKKSVGIFVSIDRKMTDFMSVSTEKRVYKSTCESANLQWPSDHLELQISLRKVTLLEKMTWISELSSEKWLRNSVLFLESNSIVTHFHRFISLVIIMNILTSTLYQGEIRILGTQTINLKQFR